MRRIRGYWLVFAMAAMLLLVGCNVAWMQFGGAPDHPGTNGLETSITPGNVATLTQAWQAVLPHYADGAPLVAFGVSTPSGSHDVVYVTTTAGDLVALDLHTGAQLWSVSFGAGTCKINGTGPTCYTTSSPVADQTAGFVYTYGLDGKVHKVAMGSGVETTTAPWPVVATLKNFDEKGSSALALATAANGHTYLYAANAGYPGDNGDYQGHVTTIDLATGTSNVFNTLCSDQAVHFAEQPATPDCAEVQSGVWARPGVTYSAKTDLIYLATGNATFSPANHDWGDTVLAIHPDGTGVNGGPVDSFTPADFQSLNTTDRDLGSTLPALVPVPAGARVTHGGVADPGGGAGRQGRAVAPGRPGQPQRPERPRPHRWRMGRHQRPGRADPDRAGRLDRLGQDHLGRGRHREPPGRLHGVAEPHHPRAPARGPVEHRHRGHVTPGGRQRALRRRRVEPASLQPEHRGPAVDRRHRFDPLAEPGGGRWDGAGGGRLGPSHRLAAARHVTSGPPNRATRSSTVPPFLATMRHRRAS